MICSLHSLSRKRTLSRSSEGFTRNCNEHSQICAGIFGIKEILKIGDLSPECSEALRIHAGDVMMMAGAQVMILNKQGKVIEKGDGIKGKGDWRDYVPGAEGKAILKARDLANVVRGG